MEIWKYQLEPVKFQVLEMPQNATILSVKNQRNCVCLWAMIDPNAPVEQRTIETLGTGESFDKRFNRKFLDTVVVGALVWHIFEMTST